MMVSAGLAGRALGKTELSQIQSPGTSKQRPSGSTTARLGSVPIRHVPMVCATRGAVKMSRAPAAVQASVMKRTACASIARSFSP